MHPLVSAILAGVGGGYRKTTVSVTTAQILEGKAIGGWGYDEGPDGGGAPNLGEGSVPYGSISPDTVGGAFVESMYRYVTPTPDRWYIWLTGTGFSKDDILKIDAEDNSGNDVLTVDANVVFIDTGSVCYWYWNATDHTLPDWDTGLGTFDVSIWHRTF